MVPRTRFIQILYPVVTAVVMIILVRSGLLTPLFLIPLGVLARRANKKTTIITAALMVILNAGFSLVVSRFDGAALGIYLADTLYVSALVIVFLVFLIPGIVDEHFYSIRATYRIILASLIGTLCVLPALRITLNDSSFIALVNQQADAVASMLRESLSGDVVQQSLIEQGVNAQAILDVMKSVALRGGLLVTHVLFLGASAAIIRLYSPHQWSVSRFHVDFQLIWILSGMLLAILAGYMFNLQAIEILGWNGALITLLLYFLQGLGIVWYGFEHPRISRGTRFLLRTLLLFVLISPGINAIILAGITLLGIAENWVSFRKPYHNGPSSTPEM